MGTISDRKGSKFLNKNGTISGKDQKSSTKMVPFLKRAKIPQQKCYHFNQKRVKISQQKMVPFQKMIKNPKQKWYHFIQKRVKIPQQKWYHFRKGSKILNKNCIISDKVQKSSTKKVTFQSEKGQNSSTKMLPF